jgi:hypothetical protein
MAVLTPDMMAGGEGLGNEHFRHVRSASGLNVSRSSRDMAGVGDGTPERVLSQQS